MGPADSNVCPTMGKTLFPSIYTKTSKPQLPSGHFRFWFVRYTPLP